MLNNNRQSQLDNLAQIQSQLVMMSSQIQQLQPLTNSIPGNRPLIQNQLRQIQQCINVVNQELSKQIGLSRYR